MYLVPAHFIEALGLDGPLIFPVDAHGHPRFAHVTSRADLAWLCARAVAHTYDAHADITRERLWPTVTAVQTELAMEAHVIRRADTAPDGVAEPYRTNAAIIADLANVSDQFTDDPAAILLS